jgi:hypothetical protein
VFRADVWQATFNQSYAVTRDGQRFLVNTAPRTSRGAMALTVALNWTSDISP